MTGSSVSTMSTPAKNLDGIASKLEAMRTPPHSLEAEQAVLGGLMLDNNTWEQVADRVVEEDFYRQDHRLIFRAMVELTEAGKPFDAVTLSEWMGERDRKSTRLNSSHPSISYAVFCLKKK